MTNKFDIEEPFIPEGLEFRQEYLDQALNLYQAEKTRLWWKKAGWISGVAAGIIGTVICFVLIQKPEVKVPAEVHQAAPSGENKEITTGNNESAASSMNQSVQSEATNDVINEINSTSNAIEVNKPAVSSPSAVKNQQESGSTRETFGQGGSGSSGSESPDQGSHTSTNGQYKKVFDVSGSSTRSNVDSGSDNPVVNKALVDNTTVTEMPVGISASSAENASLTLTEELKHEAAAPFILSRPYQPFQFDFDLRKAGVIPTEPWKRLTPFLSLGLNPAAGFGSSNNQWKPDPFVAGGIEYKFHHGLSLSFAARYYSISGMSLPLSVERTTYGQGYLTSTETYHTDRLHYGGAAFYVNKSFGQHHEVSLGYAADYLITGNNRIVSSEESTFENRELGSRKVNGFVKGFEDLNHSLQIGYRYQIGRNKSVGLNYQFGMTDITRNDIFQNSLVHRNSMLSLYFRLNLRK